ncbi:uncharacterized protein YjbI with pentapeptide repeats [Streptomyces sp. TE3672]
MLDRPLGMPHPSPEPSPVPPDWPHCGHGTTPENPVGCRGIQVLGHTACLAHLADTDRDAYLAGLTPGTDIDHRGTPFAEPLLDALLSALHDPAAGHPRLGDARFEGAQFSGNARFSGAQFSGDARFDGAQFSGDARFEQVRFSVAAVFGDAKFSDLWSLYGAHGDIRSEQVQFSGDAWFSGAQFSGDAIFGKSQFSGRAVFDDARFSGQAWFAGARFSYDCSFRAQFSGDAIFGGAQFSTRAMFRAASFAAGWFGPVVCAGTVDISLTRFETPVTMDIAAREVYCYRTQWQSTATLRLRYATANLDHAVLVFPLAVTAHPAPFKVGGGTTADESVLADFKNKVGVVSVRGVDAAYLVLTDTDLSDCAFSGAFHLDQLRLEGRCTFAPTPTGVHRHFIWPCRWTPRRTLAEEHHWRAQTTGQPTPSLGPPSPRHWRTGPHHPDPELTPDPEDVSTLYRQLRKSFEDNKNEPGAADFYYGEMEMRRHDRTDTTRAERGLLHGYWMLSGYGLRASRALGWLAAAMLITIALLMGFGLPKDAPKQEGTGTVPPGGGKVTFEIEKADPQNPTGDRFTGERFEKALNVTFNSVVFRSSGQDLTTTGTYIEMASRLTEPILLGLAVLAVRNRVKR